MAWTVDTLFSNISLSFKCCNIPISRVGHLGLNLAIEHNAACANDIDCCITSFSGIIEEVASPLKHNIHVSNSENSDDLHSCNNSPWFNEECFDKRRLFYSCLNLDRNSKTDVNRKNMVTARSQFKTGIRKCKLEFDKGETAKFKI